MISSFVGICVLVTSVYILTTIRLGKSDIEIYTFGDSFESFFFGPPAEVAGDTDASLLEVRDPLGLEPSLGGFDEPEAVVEAAEAAEAADAADADLGAFTPSLLSARVARFAEFIAG